MDTLHEITSVVEEAAVSKPMRNRVGGPSLTAAAAPTDLFANVRRNRTSLLPAHQRLCAVLEALSETIREQKSQESATAYFGVISTALQAQLGQAYPDVDVISSLLHLLTLALPHVPLSVVRAKISSSSKIIWGALHAHADVLAVARPALLCAKHVLCASQDKDEDVMQVWRCVLNCSVNSTSKVRKAALETMRAVLPMVGQTPAQRAMLTSWHASVLSFYANLLAADAGERPLLLALSSVSLILPLLSLKAQASLSMQLVALPSRDAQPSITLASYSSLMAVLKGMCAEPAAKPAVGAAAPLDTLPNAKQARHVVRLVQQLIELPAPSARDQHMLVARCQLLSSALSALSSADAGLCGEYAVRVLEQLMPMLVSGERVVSDAAQAACLAAIEKHLPSHFFESEQDAHNLAKFTTVLSGAVIPLYQSAWPVLFPLLLAFALRLQERALPLLLEVTRLVVTVYHELLDMRNDGSPPPPWKQGASEFLMGMVVAVGPHAFVDAVPLNVTAHLTDPVPAVLPPLRTWLLPMFLKCIGRSPHSRLQMFKDYFVPLMQSIEARQATLPAECAAVRELDVLLQQIWALLPAFCAVPHDIVHDFKAIAKMLGTQLQGPHPAYRRSVCLALRTLIQVSAPNALAATVDGVGSWSAWMVAGSTCSASNSSSSAGARSAGGKAGGPASAGDGVNGSASGSGSGSAFKAMDDEQAVKNVAALASYARNFLPVLFNVLSSCLSASPSADSAASPDADLLHDTIRHYVAIAHPDLSNSFFGNVVGRLLEASAAVSKQDDSDEARANADAEAGSKAAEQQHLQQQHQLYFLVYLTLAFVPRLQPDNLDLLFNAIRPILRSGHRRQQKKSYKVLSTMCSCQPRFLESHVDQLTQLLLDSKTLLACSPASKKNRLQVVQSVVAQLSLGADKAFAPSKNSPLATKRTELVQRVLAEVVLCARETNAKARSEAFSVLVSLALVVAGGAPQSPNFKRAALEEYVGHVAAGLAGSSHQMLSASIVSLSRLLFEFKDHMSEGFVLDLASTVAVLLGSTSKEVTKSALGFVRVCLYALPAASLLPHLSMIMKGVASCLKGLVQQDRVKTKGLLLRLVRKFGYEAIESQIPEEQRRVLHSIVKSQDRSDRKKKQNKEGGQHASFERELGDDSDSEDEQGNASAAARGKAAPAGRSSGASRPERQAFIVDADAHSKQNKLGNAGLGLDSHNVDIVDFLDTSIVSRVLSSEPKSEGSNPQDANTFRRDAKGRLVFTDEEADARPEQQRAKQRLSRKEERSMPIAVQSSLLEQDDDLEHQQYSLVGRKRKRRAAADNDEEGSVDSEGEEADDARSVQAQSKERTRPGMAAPKAGPAAKRQRGAAPAKPDLHSGQSYKAKGKNQGDVKISGKLDPYAYVPLDPKLLNKRSRSKAHQAYKPMLVKTRKARK